VAICGQDRAVNILAPPKARLSIEIVHDLVCPWCFLGMRRLLRTLRRRPDLLYDLSWRPFLLDPDMPRTGMSRPDYAIRKFGKFGGEDRARRLYGTITEIGRGEGVLFRFDRLRRAPSSVDAHRLVRFASRFGAADGIVETLFSAHFTDGLDIGDESILVAIGQAAGLGARTVRRFLQSGEEVDAVHAENFASHQLGVSGVPCFVIAGRHAIAGAQEPEVIERLLDVAAMEAAES
jgi:predicted DsbA family dithiol-disulfide isomerase